MPAGKAKGFVAPYPRGVISLFPGSDLRDLGPAWPYSMVIEEKLSSAQHVSGWTLQSWNKWDTNLGPTAVCCLHCD